MMTRAGVERIMRLPSAWPSRAPASSHRHHQSNAQRHAMVMWDEIALQISGRFLM